MASQSGTGGSAGNPNSTAKPSDVKVEDASEQSAVSQDQVTEDWDSERRLVSALAMLQDMDAKIHQLRTLVPDRLLAPLKPIAAQDKGDTRSNIPKSPQDLFEQLSQTAQDGVAEVDAFKSAWNRPEMKAIWDRVDQKVKESAEDPLQPTGIWERDYGVLLKRLEEGETRKQDQAKRKTEQSERDHLTSVQGGWKGIIESFIATSKPGLTIKTLSSTDDLAQFSVLLHSTSTLFLVQNTDVQNVGEWVVSMNSHGTMSKTIDGIFNSIKSRDRKWDLPYLLDMFSSYVDVKKAQCTSCNRLLDSDAQLPTSRKPRSLNLSNAKNTFSWEPYHPRCV